MRLNAFHSTTRRGQVLSILQMMKLLGVKKVAKIAVSEGQSPDGFQVRLQRRTSFLTTPVFPFGQRATVRIQYLSRVCSVLGSGASMTKLGRPRRLGTGRQGGGCTCGTEGRGPHTSAEQRDAGARRPQGARRLFPATGRYRGSQATRGPDTGGGIGAAGSGRAPHR